MRPQLILVAGPYRSGTGDDPALIAKNVHAMTEASLQLFHAGHLPVMGEWFALPLIEHAGSTCIGDAVFDSIFHPISRRLVARCDGCLRIGGASTGADEMVALARANGKPVYFSIDDIPGTVAAAAGIDDPEAVVQRQLDAFNARDIDALLAVYADDAQMFEHPSTLLASGSAAFRERYLVRFREPDLHARLIKRIVMGSVVIDHEEVTRNFPGGRGTLALVMIYEVRDGRIARSWSIPGATTPAA
ncbi:MAG TPA: nuclear transport factor 2 family protein [Albitalea sp.]|nr:nuclear transport factor 2 family protein [Albitalea sp.]